MMLNIFYKVFVAIIAFVTALGFGPSVHREGATPLSINNDKSNMNFVVWGDPQIAGYIFDRSIYFTNACQDIKSAEKDIDALVLVGDLAENGLDLEYRYLTDNLKDLNIHNFIFAQGNHDIRLRNFKQSKERFLNFFNGMNKGKSDFKATAFNYSYDVNGYTFVVLGSEKSVFEETYFSPKQLQWLDDTLAEATADNKPVFVVNHQPLQHTNGLPITWGSPSDIAGSLGKQSDEVFAIMNKYNNVVFITGHLHTAFGQYLYEKKENVHLVNLPSLTIVNKDGFYNHAGLGFLCSVTDDQVIFTARDFNKGLFIPDGDIIIDLLK